MEIGETVEPMGAQFQRQGTGCVLGSTAGVSQKHGFSAGAKREIRVLLKFQDNKFGLFQKPPKVFITGNILLEMCFWKSNRPSWVK